LALSFWEGQGWAPSFLPIRPLVCGLYVRFPVNYSNSLLPKIELCAGSCSLGGPRMGSFFPIRPPVCGLKVCFLVNYLNSLLPKIGLCVGSSSLGGLRMGSFLPIRPPDFGLKVCFLVNYSNSLLLKTGLCAGSYSLSCLLIISSFSNYFLRRRRHSNICITCEGACPPSQVDASVRARFLFKGDSYSFYSSAR
jgi:hypothetical protein